MELIYDIGMYDGEDTAYFLETGHRVVAVEANPDLVAHASVRFANQIASGQLTVVNAAVTEDGSPAMLNISGADLGSSSIIRQRIADRRPSGSLSVTGTTMAMLIQSYGIPKYLKIDIEGADRYCVLGLSSDTAPKYVSFEIGTDASVLLSHLTGLGYRRFKVINQAFFREAANIECLHDRLAMKVMRLFGFSEPKKVRRDGRFFVSGHSSGPLPWCSDGAWRTIEEVTQVLKGPLPGWNDLHAAL